MPFVSAQTPSITQLRNTEIELGRLSLAYEATLKAITKQEPIAAAANQVQREQQQKIAAQRDLIISELKQLYQPEQEPSLTKIFNQEDIATADRFINYYRYILQQQLAQLDKPLAATTSPAITYLDQLRSTQLRQRQQIDTLQQKRAVIIASQSLPSFEENQQHLAKILTELSLPINPHQSAKKAMRPFCKKKIFPAEGPLTQAENPKDRGVLINAAVNQDVHAIADGTVVFSDWLPGYGLLIIIDHDRGYTSFYGRNRNLFAVINTQVHAGEKIATVGDTGGYSTPALYFALRYNHKFIDPKSWCR